MVTSKKALCAGIDFHEVYNSLQGCVNNAIFLKNTLSRDYDERKNFDINLLVADDYYSRVSTDDLVQNARTLFHDKMCDTALFYFAGQVQTKDNELYLITSDARCAEGGMAFTKLISMAAESLATHKIIILDCCESSDMQGVSTLIDKLALDAGVTVLLASSRRQYSMGNKSEKGVFTPLLLDALNGGVNDSFGLVTVDNVYSYIVNQSLESVDQTLFFKTNAIGSALLKRTEPKINVLKMVTDKGYELYN